ncbi:MAG TPA: glycosyltransferase family 2 protein [Gaiellales bacterium]|nr:glycosyltransferase family 2 protein [Gaiellales bacterium]
MILLLELVFWLSLAALAWTHLAYPAAVSLLARLRPRPPLREPILPTVSLIIPAYNEEAVIERKLENALALDYPADRLEVVVTSDDSRDATHELVTRFRDRGVRLIACERGGKVAAQDRAVRETSGEIVAFGDANVQWERRALRELVAPFADPAVGMACGQVRLVNPAGGTNQEGVYWRYEMWLRERESAVHSITGSNGAIYAVRREAYREVDPRFGHDLSFPYLMVQNGYRAVYEPRARATESMTTDIEDEFRRKVRMFEHAWLMLFRGRMFRLRVGPVYWMELVSHRLLRYWSGPLHVALLASSTLLASHGAVYAVALGLQLAGLMLVGLSILARGRIRPLRILHYYLLVTLATLIALGGYLRRGVPATWDKAAGTRL